MFKSGALPSNKGDYLMAGLDAAGDNCYCSFRVPSDFSSLTSVKVVFVVSTTGTIDWTVNTDFGADGETYNTHSDSDTADALGLTDNKIKVLDISDAFTGLVAGDYCGVKLTLDDRGVGPTTIKVIGLEFNYSE